MPSLSRIYDEDYFVRGVETGKSLYSHYRWMPELTMPFAHRLIRDLNLSPHDKVLDFGCARGFLVRALRLLDITAVGVDISEWAIEHAHPDVKEYVQQIWSVGDIARDVNYALIVAKDVLEHIDERHVAVALMALREAGSGLFAVVPLAGDNGTYVIPSLERDIGHRVRRPLEWWEECFAEAGWDVQWARHSFGKMKENWDVKYPKGYGFIYAQ